MGVSEHVSSVFIAQHSSMSDFGIKSFAPTTSQSLVHRPFSENDWKKYQEKPVT
jgi:hypothetical protein